MDCNFAYIEELLYTYKNKEQVLKKIDLELQEIKLRYLDGNIGAIDYSKDKIQTSNLSNVVEEQVIKAEEQTEKLLKEKALLEIHYAKLELALANITDIEQKIIEYKYFKGKCYYTWNAISKMTGLNRTSCIHYRNKLIQNIITEYNIKKKCY